MKCTKITSFLMAASLILTSCSKNNTTGAVFHLPKNEVSLPLEEKSKDQPEPLSYTLWKNYIQEENANLVFAEVTSKSIFNENRSYFENNIASPSLEEIELLVKKIEKDSDKKRKDFLFYGSSLKNDDLVLTQSLFAVSDANATSLSADKQFVIKATSKVKADLLKNILSIYDQHIGENAKVLASFILKDINDNRPDLKLKLEKLAKENSSDLKELIRNSMPELKSVDLLFKRSELNMDEQVVVSAIGIVAVSVYNIVKDKKDFQEILKTYQEVNDVVKKGREVMALVAGIDLYQKEMRQDWIDFGSSLKGIYNDSSELLNKSKGYEYKVDERKIQGFLYDSFLGTNKQEGNELNPSLLSRKISLNQNFVNTINKAEKLNGNLNLILDSTDKIAKIFKIELPSDVKKVIETTKKANAVFKTVNMAINGLRNGGVMGALSALASGPMMSLMGLETDPEAEFRGEVLSRLGVIDQKLDQVMNLQMQTIKAQMETMAMIKDMAVMVDAYHWQEMDMLAEIKDLNLRSLEMERVDLNKNLRSCELLFSYQVNAKKGTSSYKMLPYENMKMLDFDIQSMRSKINSVGDIYKMMNSTESLGWGFCLSGLNDAFGSVGLWENPIRSLYSSEQTENFTFFHKQQYHPLVELLKATKKTNVYFHLPVIEFSSLDRKYELIRTNQDEWSRDILSEYISAASLERYTAQLLVFYPFMNIDKEVWKSGLENTLSVVLNQLKSNNNDEGRDYNLLKNSLILIQSAIAQEALLSGELVFDELFKKGENVIKSSINEGDSLSYAVATNKVLMTNFLRYNLIGKDTNFKKGIFLKQYAQAYGAQDLVGLGRFFSNRVIAQNLTIDSQKQVALKLIVDNHELTYPLPTPEELEEGKILYSESMYRLQELERRVIDALIKISPKNYSGADKEMLGRMMIFL